MNKRICEIYKDGNIHWCYYNGSYLYSHNNNGPACEFASGTKYWVVDGKYHRLDGPAVEYANSGNEWYITEIPSDNELEYWLAVQNYTST